MRAGMHCRCPAPEPLVHSTFRGHLGGRVRLGKLPSLQVAADNNQNAASCLERVAKEPRDQRITGTMDRWTDGQRGGGAEGSARRRVEG